MNDAHHEEEIVARIRRGDSEAMAAFLQSRERQLFAYIERNIGQPLRRKIEAEDIFQEVSAECVRALPQVDLSQRDPFSWLCQLAERRIIDAHRKFFGTEKRDAGREVRLGAGGNSEQGGLIDLLVASITSPSRAFSSDQRELRLLQAMDQLPEASREALRLRFVDGLPSKEIARRLGKNDGAIRVMINRALKRLESIMDNDESA